MKAKLPPFAAFADRLRVAVLRYQLKTGRDLDQKKLAKQMGYSASTVNSWFKGKKLPDTEQMEALGKLLVTNPGWLAFGDQAVITGPDGEPLESPLPDGPDRRQQGGRGGKG